MDPFSTIEQAWWLGLPAAALIGVVLGASPLAWPVLAAATGARAASSGDTSARAGRRSVLALGAGITVVYAGLGFVAGDLDRVVRVGIGSYTGIGFVALSVVALGLGVALLMRPSLVCSLRPGRLVAERGPVGAFLLGVPLGLVNCPACAGVITGVAASAGAIGSTAYAVAAMAALGVGHTASLLLASGLALRPVRELTAKAAVIQRVGGVLLAATGIYYAWQAVRYGVAVQAPLP